MPVYESRSDLNQHWRVTPWVEIDDFEFFLLGSADRVSVGEESIPADLPDPLSDGQGSWRVGQDVAVARRLVPVAAQERIIVISGELSFDSPTGRVTLKRRDWIDVPKSGATVRNIMAVDASGQRSEVEVARIAGHWNEAYRSSVFKLGPGRPADYHYHDCDEYWFIFRGHAQARVAGVDYQLHPGAVVATGMGEEHGVFDPQEVFEGVGLATQLEGKRRDGHLWRGVHGDPVSVRSNGADTRS